MQVVPGEDSTSVSRDRTGSFYSNTGSALHSTVGPAASVTTGSNEGDVGSELGGWDQNSEGEGEEGGGGVDSVRVLSGLLAIAADVQRGVQGLGAAAEGEGEDRYDHSLEL